MKISQEDKNKFWFKLFRYVDLKGIDDLYRQLPEAQKDITFEELDTQKKNFRIGLNGVLASFIEAKLGKSHDKETTITTVTKEIESYEKKIETLISYSYGAEDDNINDFVSKNPLIVEPTLVTGLISAQRLGRYLCNHKEDTDTIIILRSISTKDDYPIDGLQTPLNIEQSEYIGSSKGLNIYVSQTEEGVIVFPMSLEKRIAVASADLFGCESYIGASFLGYISKPFEQIYHIKPFAVWQRCTAAIEFKA